MGCRQTLLHFMLKELESSELEKSMCLGGILENKPLMTFVCLLILPAGWIGEYWSGRHCWWKSQTDSRAHLEHHSPLAGACVCVCVTENISSFLFFGFDTRGARFWWCLQCYICRFSRDWLRCRKAVRLFYLIYLDWDESENTGKAEKRTLLSLWIHLAV